LKEYFFFSNIIKTPQVLKRWSIEKKREKEEEKVLKKRKKEKKAPRVSSNKRGSRYFERRKRL
jgi:hypothetical protein